ncbi:hypothetical protein ADUPG1_012589 [Aduncisulcus paluster]|uniref:Uncharacterized protein n=1 Tax=Aduncisulcus paluster TaxID=2918883 RepID=A0ABQ5K220_9EUKA|nr:hypothetical protein ADUPG1_012589 [Aduncisulcus paluster]
MSVSLYTRLYNASQVGKEVTLPSPYRIRCMRLFRLPPSYTFTDIEDFVVNHKWFNSPPLIFVNVIFFLDSVATLRLGGTALSLKCTLANISYEYRGRNSCWREMALLPEVKGATNRMVRLIESQLALLRKGILIPTNAGDAIIVGNITWRPPRKMPLD